ncbi:MAG TPA: rhomboid family intramembrane serine protease [Bacteroidales bacterium]|nr:rhomboid family intramembrane serine protease [Bacteroidales bacterium]
MVYQQRQENFGDAVKRFFRKPSVLPRLILLNLLVFLIVYVVNLILWLFKAVDPESLNIFAGWLAVPSEPARLIQKPWTIFTYMFLHVGALHLLFNMWMLYFGGLLFLRYLSDRQLLATYIFGGLSGALVYILSYNFFPVFLQANPYAIALGASASVLAIVVAIAAWVPNFPVNLLFIGSVRIKYIALALIIIDFFSIQGSNPGGHLAHIGGAAWGLTYAWLMRRGYDPSVIFNLGWLFKRKIRFKSYPAEKKSRPETDEQYNRRRAEEQKAIDLILDKIARSGYDSLSSREKEILFKSSNKRN